MADSKQTIKGRGRPFPVHMPLGRMMADDGLTVTRVTQITGIHHRVMTEYLAGRLEISVKHKALLSELFQCDPDDFDLVLLGDEDGE